MTKFNMNEVEIIANNIRGLSDTDLLRLIETVGKTGKSLGFRKGVVIGVLAIPTMKLTSKLARRFVEKNVISYFENKSIFLEEIEETGDYDVILKDKDVDEVGE